MLWTSGGQYNAWSAYLERWGAGEAVDGDGLPPLVKEDFTVDTWQRLMQRFWDAVNQRLSSWAAALSAAISGASDEFGVGRELALARGGLQRIRALAAHPGLPADWREQVLGVIDEQVRHLQESLEHQVEEMRRRGVSPRAAEARRRTIRDNPLTAATEPSATTSAASGPAAAAAPADPWFVDPSAGRRRRVISE